MAAGDDDDDVRGRVWAENTWNWTSVWMRFAQIQSLSLEESHLKMKRIWLKLNSVAQKLKVELKVELCVRPYRGLKILKTVYTGRNEVQQTELTEFKL